MTSPTPAARSARILSFLKAWGLTLALTAAAVAVFAIGLSWTARRWSAFERTMDHLFGEGSWSAQGHSYDEQLGALVVTNLSLKPGAWSGGLAAPLDGELTVQRAEIATAAWPGRRELSGARPWRLDRLGLYGLARRSRAGELTLDVTAASLEIAGWRQSAADETGARTAAADELTLLGWRAELRGPVTVPLESGLSEPVSATPELEDSDGEAGGSEGEADGSEGEADGSAGETAGEAALKPPAQIAARGLLTVDKDLSLSLSLATLKLAGPELASGQFPAGLRAEKLETAGWRLTAVLGPDRTQASLASLTAGRPDGAGQADWAEIRGLTAFLGPDGDEPQPAEQDLEPRQGLKLELAAWRLEDLDFGPSFRRLFAAAAPAQASGRLPRQAAVLTDPFSRQVKLRRLTGADWLELASSVGASKIKGFQAVVDGLATFGLDEAALTGLGSAPTQRADFEGLFLALPPPSASDGPSLAIWSLFGLQSRFEADLALRLDYEAEAGVMSLVVENLLLRDLASVTAFAKLEGLRPQSLRIFEKIGRQEGPPLLGEPELFDVALAGLWIDAEDLSLTDSLLALAARRQGLALEEIRRRAAEAFELEAAMRLDDLLENAADLHQPVRAFLARPGSLSLRVEPSPPLSAGRLRTARSLTELLNSLNLGLSANREASPALRFRTGPLGFDRDLISDESGLHPADEPPQDTPSATEPETLTDNLEGLGSLDALKSLERLRRSGRPSSSLEEALAPWGARPGAGARP
ncbi:MAG: hypothetical protein LBU12_08830 [Deltaproteobacteria bacterium]|nr:hypothetical protein [Deltaproteobacteria bacterium]